MHYKEVKGLLLNGNGMNIYRGCQHGCIYCDSRSLCYHIEHDFEDIEVKSNALELLENALRRKRSRCMIGTGSMSDPYMPLEKSERLMRGCLELIDKYGFGATVLTKSDLVLRDIDLYKRINEKTKSVVQMTLTTFDEELCRILEPKVCTTARRAQVLETMHSEKIPTVVWMTPLLPFINDSEENLLGLLDYCAAAQVKGVIAFNAFGVTLREGDREYFYKKLDEHFPGMKKKYIKSFGNSYECSSPHSDKLNRIFCEYCAKYGIMTDPGEIFAYLNRFEDKSAGEQLSLFEL